MAKFRQHFVDGSWVSAMTMRRRNIEGIADRLGKITDLEKSIPDAR